MGGSSEHVHYGATTLPLMRASCLPEHTLQAACSFRVTHNAEGPDQPRVQRPHTHTLIDTVSPPLLPTGAANLVAANTEDAVSSLSRSLESNTEAITREYIEYQHRVLHHELTFCVQISITPTLTLPLTLIASAPGGEAACGLLSEPCRACPG